MTAPEGRTLVFAMCIGQLGNLLPHVVVPAIMAQHLMPLWQLSATEAGLMAGAYAFGYMLSVPFLTTATDHTDARVILLGGSLVSGAAAVAFGLFADGLLSASLLWALAGAGFGGAYMPGLKALTDRLPPGNNSRAVTLYTSSFSVGVGFSFLCSPLLAEALGWRAAFVITGLGPLIMVAVALWIEPHRPEHALARRIDFAPVLQNRTALGYILGYGAHCFELYGLRTWLVPFWTFVAATNSGGILSPIAVSFLVTVLSLPASVLGNEAALRFGRHRALTVIMIASALTAGAIGLLAGASPVVLLCLLAIYSFTVPGDSGALTSGMSLSATPTHRGATMALHSTVGFGLSAIGAWATGFAIDAAGGPASASGWLAAFALLGFSILLGPVALWWSRSQRSLERPIT